ncbi:MAG: acyl-CoA reductase [Chitinophagaceae bacterium]|nr:acyl-CoA reductase [Chitinophagaceae bacterium]MCW5905434.1 acyl-CoA reductase [Chitinophagaceae bacterium]
MTLQERINLLEKLGAYMQSNYEEWKSVQERAYAENAWFIPTFISTSIQNIVQKFLQKEILEAWAKQYNIANNHTNTKKVGVVMAGNIPLVGFHDFLCVFMSGNRLLIKTSSKDSILIKHIVAKMEEWNEDVKNYIQFAEVLKKCDAYIATGSNNSSRYFDYYFGKYPHIIRRNRTSVAVLTGKESKEDLALLANDIQLYFGLGCRNVTKLLVPQQYDFMPLIDALKQYEYYIEYHKYKHNYDYHLALLIMGNKVYMNTGSLVITENKHLFSPISQLHYEYYDDAANVINDLHNNNDVQCIVGTNYVPFGVAQQPCLTDYADGVDTMQFLMNL